MQLRLMLPMIFQTFRLEMIPNTKIDFSFRITMRPRHSVPMIVRKQDRGLRQKQRRTSGLYPRNGQALKVEFLKAARSSGKSSHEGEVCVEYQLNL